MNTQTPDLELLLHDAIEKLRHGFVVDRREFVKLLGGGLLIFAATPDVAQESGAQRRGGGGEQMPRDVAAWLHIGENGQITVYTGKVEVGQNIRTSLTQHVAEELRVAPEHITLIMGDTSLVPYDAGTFGSRSTPQMGRQLRLVAATAREALIDLAAKKFGTDRAALVAEDGHVRVRANHEVASYAELARGQKIAQPIGGEALLASADKWTVAGHDLAKRAGADFVTGKHQYTSDVTRPGMLIGRVLRPAAFGAKLSSFNVAAAEKLPNVQVVRDGDFAGVAAPDQHTAQAALAALQAEWTATPQPGEAQLFDLLRQPSGEGGGGGRPQVTGNVAEALAGAPHKLSATYTVAYIAHTPLEPRAAVAEWNGDQLTVWTGTQRPFGVRDELVQAFHLAPENVRVIMPDTGSAYGGKHTGECAIEAARLAKAAGKPVKLVWTREEEFTWAYFRPAGVIDVKSGAAADGTLVAWKMHNYNSGPSAIQTPYAVANQHTEFHPAKSPLRIGSYRGLAATANHFARESHMDELAHELKLEPLAFRLKNLQDARLRAAFEAAAEKFGWGKEKATPERAFGIGGGVEKGGYTACCAEVTLDKTGRVRITRIVVSFDCGAVVNPNGLRNQVSGAIVQGIGGALFEAVHFDDGKITNPHMTQYRLPRFNDTPPVEVVLIDRKDQPSAGAGETPIVGIAPAVANAIFSATGKRLRAMPLVPGGMPT